MNRTIFLAVAGAVIASGAPSFAADWNGAYVGLNLGVAFGDSKVATQVGSNGYFAPSSITSIDATAHQTLKPTGFTGGGQLGFNHQTGHWVWGLEGDFDALNLNKTGSTGDVTYPCCSPASYAIQQTVKTNWVATVRPRLGWANNNWLLYATGGVAFADVKYSEKFSDTFASASEASSKSETKTGWAAGAGMEWAVGPHTSLKAEYLHDDLGKVSSTGSVFSGTTLLHSADLKADIVRVGMNWRF